MSSKTSWALPVLGILIVVAVIMFVREQRPNGEEESEAPVVAESSAGKVAFLMEQQWQIKLKLAKVEASNIAPQITSTGRIVPAPQNQAVVAPPVGGILRGDGLPRVGQEVARGQVIATITQMLTPGETAQLRVESIRMDAERRRLAEAINEGQLRRNYAKTEFDRATRLYERKAYSQKQMQAAEADFKAAEAAIATLTAQMNALNVSPDPVAPPYTVTAPISGTVVKVHKTIGEQVQPGEGIIEIVNLESVWVEAPVFEKDLARLRTGNQAIFTTTSFPTTEFRGKLIDIGAVIDEQTRAASAVFEVPNPSRMLRIGMQANVRLDAQGSVNAVMVPKEAILDHEGKKIVYVLLTGEEFQRVEVEVGDEYGGKVAVLSGLQSGQRVVTQGAYQLKLQELRPANAGAHTHEA